MFLLVRYTLLLLTLFVHKANAFVPSSSKYIDINIIDKTTTKLYARPQTRFRNVQKNILTRRTINEFDTILPNDYEQKLNNAIEAAIYAPNHKRSEPWRFYLLGPKAIEEVCKLNADIVASKKGEAAGEKKLKRWLQMPGWLVVTCVKSSEEEDGDGGSSMEDPMSLAREDYAAVCCAVQNLCLSLHSQGIGTKWTTGGVNFDDQFGEIVGFSSNEETVGTIWFGTALQQPSPPMKKLALDDVLKRTE